MELFIGFFVAMIVLSLPMISLMLAIQFWLDPLLVVIAFLVLYLGLFVLMGTAIFLARRYHLSRTRYRGVRFAQTGSSLKYGFLSMGYTFLTGLTIGWFAPEAHIRLARRMWNGASFGSEPIQFEDTEEAMAEPVWKSFAIAWVGGLIGYTLWGMWFATNMDPEMMVSQEPDIGFIITLYVSLIPLGLFIGTLFAWHHAVMMRRITKSLRMGSLRPTSTFSTWDAIELTVTNTLLIIFTLGIGTMAAQMRLWRRYAERLEFHGHVDFSAIQQSSAAQPSTGEGLADGLDLVSNF